MRTSGLRMVTSFFSASYENSSGLVTPSTVTLTSTAHTPRPRPLVGAFSARTTTRSTRLALANWPSFSQRSTPPFSQRCMYAYTPFV